MTKFKYYLNNQTILIFIVLLFLSLFIVSVKADTNIIYDNITTSQYKIIKLDDSIVNLMDSKFEIYINGQFLGYYTKNENIFIPDNSNVTIFIPSDILTSTDNIWTTNIKPMAFTVIGFTLTWGLLIIIVCFILYRIIRKIWKGY